MDEFLNLTRGNRIEGRARLVHEQNLWAIGNSAGNAETLHLAPREAEGTIIEAIFDLIPERGLPKRGLTRFLKDSTVADPDHAKRVDHILENRFGEGVRLLEDHAHAATERDDLQAWIVNRASVDGDVPLMTNAVHEVIHPVKITEERRLTTA